MFISSRFFLWMVIFRWIPDIINFTVLSQLCYFKIKHLVWAKFPQFTMHWIRQNSYEYYILCLVYYWGFPLWLVIKGAVLGPMGVLGIVHTNPFLFLFPKPWVASSHMCADQSQLKTQQGLTRILSCLVLYPINSWPLCPLLCLLNSERTPAISGFFLPVQ